MKRVLVLLGRYYPHASANSVCVKNIIDCLPTNKYEVDIISYDDGSQNKYGNVYRVSRGILQTSIYKVEDTGGSLSRLNLLNFLNKLKMLMCFISWPWTDPIVTGKIMRRAKALFEREPYDFVIAIYMPLSSLIVAHSLKKQYPNSLYIAYFLDSLSGGNLPAVFRNKFYEKKLVNWEKGLTANADKIVFMKSSESFHRSLYENSIWEKKISYLDLPMFIKQKCIASSEGNVKRIVYVGSLASSVRSPDYILKVFSRIKEKNINLIFVGDVSSDKLIELAAKDNRIKILGRCSHRKALEWEANADILLNLGNKNPNLAPSKVFEYMSFGKKIVSTYSIDNDAGAAYLKRYSNVLLLDARNDDIESAASRLLSFINKPLIPVAHEEMENLFQENTPQAFVSLMESMS